MNKKEAIKLRKAIVQGSKSLPDDVATNVPNLFPVWESNAQYQVGDRRRYKNTLYKCIQAHTSQTDWTPDVSVSLWSSTNDPSIEWPEWKQPIGAADAYSINSKVSHNNLHWISDTDNNVWEPGVYGWHSVE